MPRGGARSNAGRKAGEPNKATAQLRAEIAATGETPLDYMLRVMRDRSAEHKRRDDMAKAAAPYVHSRLETVSHVGEKPGEAIKIELNDVEAARRVAFVLAAGAHAAAKPDNGAT